MPQYLLRLDDASSYGKLENWDRIEKLLEQYQIAPIVGIIPANKDEKLIKNAYDGGFWDRARHWQEKGWCIALHGYDHRYCSESGGINPVNQRSEFAGSPLTVQEQKIEQGLSILKEQGINPKIFFAPAHTFDENTLLALKNKSDIRIISDTVADDVYYENELFFIPQQAGTVRQLPFKTVTFCYHPNEMSEIDFVKLEQFIKNHQNKFIRFSNLKLKKRKKSYYDRMLSFLYFKVRHLFS